MNAKAVALYLDWQDMLRRFGVGHAARDAFFELAKHIEASPFFDCEGFEATLERLHRAAYPVGGSRPPRLTAEIPGANYHSSRD